MKLTIRNGWYGYDDEQVLRGISVEVEPGEVLAVIGPSGSGKTTMLRLAALFDGPETGTIRCDGIDPWEAPDRRRLQFRRRIGTVFQKPSLFDTTVERNVASGFVVRRPWRDRLIDAGKRLLPSTIVPDPEPPGSVADALEIVGLEGEGTRTVGSLSGGEAQRVSFARAFATDPDLLVLDEPTSDLDPRNTALLEGAIERARARGHGVVLATHDMHQAKRLADRVAFLFEGKLIEVGPPEQVFEAPTDRRTARFVRGDLLYDPDELSERDRSDGKAPTSDEGSGVDERDGTDDQRGGDETGLEKPWLAGDR